MTAPDTETGPLEGGGIVSGYADVADAVHAEHVDPLQVLATTAGAGLDTLGFVADPLGSLLTAGIGWLIEHIDFLSEPLDALAGDPAAIRAQAAAWHVVATELTAVATDYRDATSAVTVSWHGDAAEAYARAVDRCTTGLDRTAADAAEMANLVVASGAMVGTMRAVIRDAIAAFIADVIQWVVAALAASVVTAGFSLAALVAAVVEQAVWLARSCVRRISALLDMLDEASTTAASLASSIRHTATGLSRASGAAGREIRSAVADPAVVGMQRTITETARDGVTRFVPDGVEAPLAAVHTGAERAGAAGAVEMGKQVTGEEQKQREWD